MIPLQLETDEQIIERLRDRFAILEDMTKAVKSGKVRAMIVSGAPGIGKSFGVEDVLSKHDTIADIAGDQSLKKYEICKGALSALGLYAKLFAYRNEKNILVFDDCDSIFGDEVSLNLAKAALDTSAKRVIHWNTDSRLLKEHGIPNSFEFKGGAIFITNIKFENVRSKKLKDHLAALESRCHYLDLTIHTDREKMLRIKQIVSDGMLNKYDLTQDDVASIIAWIDTNKTRLRELSLRTVIKAADLMSHFKDRWTGVAELTLLNK
jgi:hypothetical protein